MSDSLQRCENPLIGMTRGDTISRIYDYVEFLCLSADNDDTTHPGLGISLHLVRGAVDSLKEGDSRE